MRRKINQDTDPKFMPTIEFMQMRPPTPPFEEFYQDNHCRESHTGKWDCDSHQNEVARKLRARVSLHTIRGSTQDSCLTPGLLELRDSSPQRLVVPLQVPGSEHDAHFSYSVIRNEDLPWGTGKAWVRLGKVLQKAIYSAAFAKYNIIQSSTLSGTKSALLFIRKLAHSGSASHNFLIQTSASLLSFCHPYLLFKSWDKKIKFFERQALYENWRIFTMAVIIRLLSCVNM